MSGREKPISNTISQWEGYYINHIKGAVMPQSLSKIIVHIVFGTKYREKIIPKSRLQSLHAYMAGVCRHHSAEAYQVGGTEDHIHIACRLPRTVTVAKLVEEVKKASSKWMKIGEECVPTFHWQDGYGAFSISQSHLPKLIHYIENQERHHQTQNYENELREICAKYEVEPDILLTEDE